MRFVRRAPVQALRRSHAIGAPRHHPAAAGQASAAHVHRDCGRWFAAAPVPRLRLPALRAAQRARSVAPHAAVMLVQVRAAGGLLAAQQLAATRAARPGAARGAAARSAGAGAAAFGAAAWGAGAARAAGAACGAAACPGGPPPPPPFGAPAAGIAIPAERMIRSAVMRALDCNMTPAPALPHESRIRWRAGSLAIVRAWMGQLHELMLGIDGQKSGDE